MIDLAGIGSFYQEGIVDTGREPAFLFLVSFLATFGFIRTSAHMIRAQVSWWPGNVTVGGTHVHHLVWGIIILLVSGYIGIAVDPGSPGREIVACAFGFGTGLTLDEFALWLELRDVYWEEEGRKSIDAVIIAATLAGLVLVGYGAWIEVADEVERGAQAVVGLFGLLAWSQAAVNAAKLKPGMAVAGLFIPLIGIVSAFRLARPNSLWARRYGAEKLARARGRFGSPAPAAEETSG